MLTGECTPEKAERGQERPARHVLLPLRHQPAGNKRREMSRETQWDKPHMNYGIENLKEVDNGRSRQRSESRNPGAA
jgi:hypothetical protein